MTIVGFTGNRILSHDEKLIKEAINDALIQYNASRAITGFALGFDQLVAKVCIEIGLPFTAAIPYAKQAEKWSAAQQQEYLELLEKATDIVIVSEGEYAVWKLFKRNDWIVNNSDMIVAYAMMPDGGAASCCVAAAKAGKKVVNLLRQP